MTTQSTPQPAMEPTSLWIVGGWYDENKDAQRLCTVLGYERMNSKDVLRIEFLEPPRDLFFDTQESTRLIPVHGIFPVIDEPDEVPA